ncbi:molybdopterin molybdenumtransferase MoeA [Aeromicrobium flavum]|uniref:Molybdopterin molybdenumtransferase n=1 Tax=Aeromicrobium flavum TaxID=416568 RepID=A0A512HW24_9ACTN|nr:molybdopterin molybdotransferase MoeA [Aeromicrobium flavum]GEO89654.1 molybdopterin molybdenumtransferase MoeA [Aeromicrobium flavum]
MSDVPWGEARRLARAAVAPGELITVRLGEALGCTAADDLLALGPVPHAVTSAMDGWAVAGAGPWLVDESDGPLEPGRARAIVTGGVPPEGTAAVLPTERGEVSGDRLHGEAPPPGWHLRPAGEEAAPGDVIVTAGSVLTPARLAVLATTGHDQVAVRRAPLVHLLVTGDELVASGVPQPGQVRDVMTPMLPPLLTALGVRIAHVDRVPDDPRAVARAAEAGDVDLVISAGGTGRSSADPIDGAWAALDADVRFRGVDMRPGHPVSLAVLPDGRPWLALPGNPLAAVMTTLSLVPALVAGHTGGVPADPAIAIAAATFAGRAGTTLVPAIHTPAGVVPAGTSRPHMLRGLADAEVVAIVPDGGIEPGSPVGVLPRVW